MNVRIRVLPALIPINGVDGREVELQQGITHIQWRYDGETDWVNLIAIEDLIGPSGPAVELRSDGSSIQYRVSGAVDWIDVVPLVDLTGPPGPAGADGANGATGATGATGPGVASGGSTGQVLAKTSDTNYATGWVDPPSGSFDTVALAAANDPAVDPSAVIVLGYAAAGDGGGARYRKVASEPTHGGKFQNANGTWYELAEMKPSLRMFGAIPGVDDAPSAAANVAAVNAAIAYGSYFEASREDYYFGTWTGNTSLFTAIEDSLIDWKWAHIIVDGDDVVGTSSTYFITAVDCRLSMHNYEFTDRSFDFNAPGEYRGCAPVGILNDAVDTSGYNFGPFIIHTGQSLLTVGSLNPSTARASNISFIGRCVGGQTYYGVNLANNGDNFRGDYDLGEFNRAWFIYGVKGFYARITAETGQASSSNGLTKYYDRDTEDVYVDFVVGSLNGAITIESQTDAAGAYFRNINIKAYAKEAGANLTVNVAPVRIRMLTAAGVVKSTGDLAIDGLTLDVTSDAAFVRPVDCYTISSGIGPIRLSTNLNWQGTQPGGGVDNTPLILIHHDGRGINGAIVGAINSVVYTLPFSTLRPALNGVWMGILDVRINGYTGGLAVMAQYAIRIAKSAGAITAVSAQQLWQKEFISGTRVITISFSGANVTITATGFASGTTMEIEADLKLTN